MSPTLLQTFGRCTVSAVATLVLSLGLLHSQPVSAQTVDETWKFILETVTGPEAGNGGHP